MKKFFLIILLFGLIFESAFSQTIVIHTNNGMTHQFNLSEIDSITFSESTSIISTKDLLAKDNEVYGWLFAGSSWVADNFSELTTYINGMAEIYQRHGFVDAAHQTYQGTIDNVNRQLSLTIYNQGNESNALATYEDPDTGLSDAVIWTDGAGQAAHYIRYNGLSQALTFYRGQYFVYLVINCDTDESLNLIKQFALTVDANIQQ
jgi:hypothetical protein